MGKLKELISVLKLFSGAFFTIVLSNGLIASTMLSSGIILAST
jgi:hypothetical protein